MAHHLSGRHIDTAEAPRLGLAQEVRPHDELLAGAEAWCARASQMPAHSLEMAKSVLRGASDASWEQSLRLEEFAQANCYSTAELGEAAEEILARNKR